MRSSCFDGRFEEVRKIENIAYASHFQRIDILKIRSTIHAVENGFQELSAATSALDKAQGYRMDPEVIDRTADAIVDHVRNGRNFFEACELVIPSVARCVEVQGAEHVPSEGPLIVAANHPTHLDFLWSYAVGRLRPELKIISSLRSSHLQRMAAVAGAFIDVPRDERREAEFGDTRLLMRTLERRESVSVVPWGTLDHRVGESERSTPERSIRNILRFARAAQANILPVHVSVEAEHPGHVPFQRVRLSIHSAVAHDQPRAVADRLMRIYPHHYANPA